MQERLLARGACKVVETPQLFAHNHRLLLASTKAQCHIGLYIHQSQSAKQDWKCVQNLSKVCLCSEFPILLNIAVYL